MTGEPTAPIALTWRDAADLRQAMRDAATFNNDGDLLARWDRLDYKMRAVQHALPTPINDFG